MMPTKGILRSHGPSTIGRAPMQDRVTKIESRNVREIAERSRISAWLMPLV